MSLISNAGFHKVSLVAETPRGQGQTPGTGQSQTPAKAGGR